jgi:hypothetical protein
MIYIYTLQTILIGWEHWIEYTEEYFGRLSWEGVSKMIKTTHLHRDQFHDITSREVDLAFGLKDKHAS